jgi:hypothetical protein
MARMNPTRCLALIATLCLAGCAGDLEYAQNAAKKASGFVGDMQRTTQNAILKQRGVHQGGYVEVAELKALAEIRSASSSRHVATWEADDTKDSIEVYQAMTGLTADENLTKTAPFVLMDPLPSFDAPAIDEKSFSEAISKLNKLSQGLSPLDRVNALIPFVKSAVKAYSDSFGRAEDRGRAAGAASGSRSLSRQKTATDAMLADFQLSGGLVGDSTSRLLTLPDTSPALVGAGRSDDGERALNLTPEESLMNALQ